MRKKGTAPDGAADSKVFSARQVMKLFKHLKYVPEETRDKKSFWMLFGTSKIN